MDNNNDIKTVITILQILNNSQQDQVSLFKSSYLRYFDVNEVPPISIHAEKLVYVDRKKAVAFLRRRYNLIPTEELCHSQSKK